MASDLEGLFGGLPAFAGSSDEDDSSAEGAATITVIAQARPQDTSCLHVRRPAGVHVPAIFDDLPCQKLMMVLDSSVLKPGRASSVPPPLPAGFAVRRFRSDADDPGVALAERRRWAEVQVSAQLGRRWRSRQMMAPQEEGWEVARAEGTFDDEFGVPGSTAPPTHAHAHAHSGRYAAKARRCPGRGGIRPRSRTRSTVQNWHFVSTGTGHRLLPG